MGNIELKEISTMPVNYRTSFGFGYIKQPKKYITIPIVVNNCKIYGAFDSNVELKDLRDCASGVGSDGKYYITSDFGDDFVGIYSIKNNRFLDIKNKRIVELYKNMFINGKEFELAYILSLINKVDLGMIHESERNTLINYLTSGNKNIKDSEVVYYILNGFPRLEKYNNLREGLSILEYRNIAKDVGRMFIKLKAMRQDLDFIEQDQVLSKEYGNIYVSKEEQHNRILQLKK